MNSCYVRDSDLTAQKWNTSRENMPVRLESLRKQNKSCCTLALVQARQNNSTRQVIEDTLRECVAHDVWNFPHGMTL